MIAGLPDGVEINEYRFPKPGEWWMDGQGSFLQYDPESTLMSQQVAETKLLIVIVLPGYALRSTSANWKIHPVRLYATPKKITILADSQESVDDLLASVRRVEGLTSLEGPH